MVSHQVKTTQKNLEIKLLLSFSFLMETKSEDESGIGKC